MTRSTFPLLLVVLSLLLSTTSCGSLGTRRAKVTPQRPRISKTTQTTAFGTFEVEAGAVVDPDDLFAVPARLKIGVSPTAELYFGLPVFVNRQLPGPDANGTGDLTIGFRQRLMNETKSFPATAIEFGVQLPSGDEKLGVPTGYVDKDLGVQSGGFMNAFGGFSLDRTIQEVYTTLYYRIGALGSNETGDLAVEHTAAVAGMMPIYERWSGLAELAFRYVPEQQTDNNPLVLNMAGIYELADTAVVDVGFVIGLNEAATEFALKAGITTNLGIFF